MERLSTARVTGITRTGSFIVSRRGSRRLLACTAMTLACSAVGAAAQAQTNSDPVQVPTISVEGNSQSGTVPSNTLKKELGVNRIPGTVQDTPQAINVITPEVIREQGVTTLEEALRNVPGITSQIGEGGGGPNGDQFRIRGIEAMGDVYSDGLREFGTYIRDSFNYESVEVLKGPSATAFGRGTTGGAINSNSKVARLDDFTTATLMAGMGPAGRATVDSNYKFNDTTAFRLNAVLHDQELVDRDAVQTRRWGIAPSLGLGLGTDLSLTLSYLHLDFERVPDYGIPLVLAPGASRSRPVTEFGVSRKNFYGLDTDADDGNIDQFTARLAYTAIPWVKLYNDFRVGFYDRYFTPQPPGCNAACVTNLFDGDPTTVPIVTRGGPAPYDQSGYGIQNVTTAVADFKLGGFRQQLVAGIDIVYEDNTNRSFMNDTTKPGTSLFDPDGAANGYTFSPSTGANARREANATQAGVFLTDRFWIIDQLSLIAGIRIDQYEAKVKGYNGTTGAIDSDVKAKSTLINPKASLVFEPTKDQTYYASWARSARPPGALISSAPIGNPFQGNQNNSALDPEVHQIFEVGTKIGIFDGKLGTSVSLFRIETDNSTTFDSGTGTIVSSGDSELTQGIELGVTGQPLPGWTVSAGYTYLDAEYTNGVNKGNRVQYTARHAATLWTTYRITRDLLVGGGFVYQSSRVTNATNTGEVPYDLSIDAVASYQLTENVRVNVNGYNLFDRENFTQIWSNRAVLSAGRTFTVSTSIDF